MKTTHQVLIATATVFGLSLATGPGWALTPPAGPTRQDLAEELLNSSATQFMTMPVRDALRAVAHPQNPGLLDALDGTAPSPSVRAGAPAGAGLVNVRVNNPQEDTTQVDQTTQSETSIAVAGSNIAVGFNDSQHTPFRPYFPAASTNLNGVAYSTDGGRTFTDGGVVPNAPGFANSGDPWLASDASGAMYYSSLAFDWAHFKMVVAVSKSTTGGKSWSAPISLGPGEAAANPLFYFADKDALTSAPSGLYDAWDDFSYDPATNTFYSGLVMAHSTDAGKTWSVSYATRVPIFTYTLDKVATHCAITQFIGAQPLVAPDGTVYLAAEESSLVTTSCSFKQAFHFSEVIFSSHDQGSTWTQLVAPDDVALSVGSSTQGNGSLWLGPGQYMRNREFPTLAIFQGALYMAFNDGGDNSGHSHIRVVSSTDGGRSWHSNGATSFITSGTDDEVQPAMSVDASGLHIAYYQISRGPDGNGQVDVIVSDSRDGAAWTARRVTSQSFPGVFTVPQFDPMIALAYMGDYIANVSDGAHQYFAWGDNRDTVTDYMWRDGRHDPDVFFARR